MASSRLTNGNKYLVWMACPRELLCMHVDCAALGTAQVLPIHKWNTFAPLLAVLFAQDLLDDLENILSDSFPGAYYSLRTISWGSYSWGYPESLAHEELCWGYRACSETISSWTVWNQWRRECIPLSFSLFRWCVCFSVKLWVPFLFSSFPLPTPLHFSAAYWLTCLLTSFIRMLLLSSVKSIV